MDLFARKLVGWAIETFVDSRLPLAAWRMALGRQHLDASLAHHSERGVQYAATAYRAVLESRGITLAMSRKGNGDENAPMESANGTIKPERVSAQR
jgi:transposase InsO family protein